MKQVHFYSLSMMLIFSACSMLTKDSTRAFIPGIYVRPIEHEFATGSDTLIIRQLDDHTYEIIKRSGFKRIRNGKFLPVEYKQEKWTGIYDDKKQVIHEQRKGKLLSFVPRENKMLVGAMVYQKLNF